MRKMLLTAALAATAVLAMAGCGKKESDATASKELDKNKTYVIGLDDTFAPMGFRDENGELVGFDIDLALASAKEMGINIEFQPIDWTTKDQELNSGNIDMIWNGMTITDERKEKFLFSNAYLDNEQLIISMAGSDINKKSDLAGKMITTQGESSPSESIKTDQELLNSLAKPPVEYPTYLECFAEIESGRCDAVVADSVLARYYIKQKGADKYKIADELFGKEEFGVGMRKDDTALCDALNKAIDALKENGTYQKIYDQWFQ